jgi:putative membrane protein insertion efficiency factor
MVAAPPLGRSRSCTWLKTLKTKEYRALIGRQNHLEWPLLSRGRWAQPLCAIGSDAAYEPYSGTGSPTAAWRLAPGSSWPVRQLAIGRRCSSVRPLTGRSECLALKGRPMSEGPTPAADMRPLGMTGQPLMSLGARAVHRIVRLYQALFAGRPSPCRYVPTCSSYALDALEQRGFFRGSWLAIRRIGRCHPWGGSGWDPVPPRAGVATHDGEDCDHHSPGGKH